MIRVGTINLQDPITVSNLFGLPKNEVHDHQLCGHIAIEVDYRIITPRVSSGSRLTEAGPTPQTKSATIFVKEVSAVGELLLLRADVGESNDAVMASGMATSSLAVSTG